jgi:hypothetical protein
MIQISKYYGTHEYSNRSATVLQEAGGSYGVIYTIDDREDYRVFLDKSVHYAEDAAENWVEGIINPKDLLVTY